MDSKSLVTKQMCDYLNIFGIPRKAFNVKESRCNDIITFDIETSTFFRKGNFFFSESEIIERHKTDSISEWSDNAEAEMRECEMGAVCYLWQFGINDNYYYGRELRDFISVLKYFQQKGIHLKIFVHNLSYEYFFLRGIIDFDKVFLMDKRSVLYAEAFGHTFACTYKLTNLSLQNWGKQNGIPKLHTLDYSAKIRTPKTRLTRDELNYGCRDLEVMYVGLKVYEDLYGDVWNIPYTQTGTLRRDVKDLKKKDVYYHNGVVNINPKNADDMRFLQATFSGAIVISNPKNTNKILHNIDSYDKTSAYPYTECVMKFPMSEFVYADTNVDIDVDDGMHHIYQIRFYNIRAKSDIHIIPSSKRVCATNMKLDNGKLISADMYECFATEVDIKTIRLFYLFDKHYDIIVHKIAKSDYLDKDLVLLILDYYARKTTLKGISGQEVFYLKGKERLNATFGMMATKLVKANIVVDGWDAPYADKDSLSDDFITAKLMEQYSRKWKSIVAYPWGIYVTSYQRFLLAEMISKIPADCFVYSDTDCLKGWLEKYKDVFNEANLAIKKRIQAVCKERDIDFELFQPKDKHGIAHLLGVWEYEGTYADFRTNGQKRYAFRMKGDDKIQQTISGVPKTAPPPSSLEDFKDGLTWDIFTSHKMLIQYKDGNNPQVVLNRGKKDEYKVDNPCAVTMRSMSYTMSLSRDYKELLETYYNNER